MLSSNHLSLFLYSRITWENVWRWYSYGGNVEAIWRQKRADLCWNQWAEVFVYFLLFPLILLCLFTVCHCVAWCRILYSLGRLIYHMWERGESAGGGAYLRAVSYAHAGFPRPSIRYVLVLKLLFCPLSRNVLFCGPLRKSFGIAASRLKKKAQGLSSKNFMFLGGVYLLLYIRFVGKKKRY